MNEENILKCEKCGGLMKRDLVDYKSEYKSENIVIKNIKGYVCSNCNYQLINDPLVKDYIKQQLKAKKLEILSNKNIEFIIISSLRRIRNKKGFSQKQLAQALNVSEQRYGAIERNTNTPTISMALILSNFLGEGLEDFYKLVTVPTSIYEKLLNGKFEIGSNNIYKFVYVEEVATIRNKVKELRQSLENHNTTKRTNRFLLQSGKITKKEHDEIIKELNKKIKDIKSIKDGSKGLEVKLKKLENKHLIIMKQESVMDIDDWEKVEIEFEELLKPFS